MPALDSMGIRPYHTEVGLLRAVENGFSVVRQTSEGASMAADYQGNVLAYQDFFRTTDRLMVADVPHSWRTNLLRSGRRLVRLPKYGTVSGADYLGGSQTLVPPCWVRRHAANLSQKKARRSVVFSVHGASVGVLAMLRPKSLPEAARIAGVKPNDPTWLGWESVTGPDHSILYLMRSIDLSQNDKLMGESQGPKPVDCWLDWIYNAGNPQSLHYTVTTLVGPRAMP